MITLYNELVQILRGFHMSLVGKQIEEFKAKAYKRAISSILPMQI